MSHRDVTKVCHHRRQPAIGSALCEHPVVVFSCPLKHASVKVALIVTFKSSSFSSRLQTAGEDQEFIFSLLLTNINVGLLHSSPKWKWVQRGLLKTPLCLSGIRYFWTKNLNCNSTSKLQLTVKLLITSLSDLFLNLYIVTDTPHSSDFLSVMSWSAGGGRPV